MLVVAALSKEIRVQIRSEESEMPDRSNQFLYRKDAAAQSSGAEVCITLPLTQRGPVPLPEVLLCALEWVGQIAVLLTKGGIKPIVDRIFPPSLSCGKPSGSLPYYAQPGHYGRVAGKLDTIVTTGSRALRAAAHIAPVAPQHRNRTRSGSRSPRPTSPQRDRPITTTLAG
jgi:hypothetical protein